MEIVFVHGALVRDGAWWWHRAAEVVETRTGVSSRAVALPSCGEGSPAVGTGLAADAAALREVLDETGPAIVVGHSYGGTVIAEAGSHPSIERLVYISSYLPDAGLSQGAIMADEADPVAVAVDDAGRLELSGYTVDTFGDRFLQDATPEIRREGWGRVTPQSAEAFTAPTSAEGWRGVDSTYLVCVDDRSTSVGLQRLHAERASRSVDLPTGHHPFLSRPDLVAEQLEALL